MVPEWLPSVGITLSPIPVHGNDAMSVHAIGQCALRILDASDAVVGI